ncbi:MAG: hypothetical protein CYG60_21760, partial [Actinobacteria bacterium]
MRGRLSRDEIDAEEYERSLEGLKSDDVTAPVRGAKSKLLVAGLAAAALLAVGGGAVYAQGQGSSMLGGDALKSETDGNGMGGMMNGGMMGG